MPRSLEPGREKGGGGIIKDLLFLTIWTMDRETTKALFYPATAMAFAGEVNPFRLLGGSSRKTLEK